MVLTLERVGLIRRQPGLARSIEMLVDPETLLVLRCRGRRARIWPTMRAVSSTAPALASKFERLSLAAIRCRPQNT